jgi:hypothetical protein
MIFFFDFFYYAGMGLSLSKATKLVASHPNVLGTLF